MKNLFEKSAAQARVDFRLDAQDKAKIRETLFLHMEHNPVRVGKGFRLHSWRLHNPFTLLLNRPMPILALFIALIMGVSTTYAAEASLPGDLLYPVKVNVNENFHSLVSVTDESQASWDVERAHRRLDEAQRLAARGTLSAEVRADVEARFKDFSERAERRIEKLKAKGNMEAAVEVSSRFESALRAHAEVLNRFQEKASDKAQDDLTSLITDIRAQVKVFGDVRQSLEAEIATPNTPAPNGDTTQDTNRAARVQTQTRTEVAAQGKLNATTHKLAEVQSYLANRGQALNAESKARILASLQIAENLIVEGKAKLEAKAYAEAFLKFQAASRELEQSKSLIKSLLEFSFALDLSARSNASGSGQAKSDTRGDGNGLDRVDVSAQGSVEVRGEAEVSGQNTLETKLENRLDRIENRLEQNQEVPEERREERRQELLNIEGNSSASPQLNL